MSPRTRIGLALALVLVVIGGGVTIAATRASSPATIVRPGMLSVRTGQR